MKRKHTGFPVCFGCNKESTNGTRPDKIGWKIRTIKFMGVQMRETICPECFEAHGWPPISDENIIEQMEFGK